MPYFFRSALIRPLIPLLLLFFLLPATARADLAEVRSAILMNMSTGKILYEQNADDPIPPASLTKILTMYIALDNVSAGKSSLNSLVRISRQAARTGGSRMALKPNERVRLESLLMGMAVSSGNDASAAVAEFLGGTQARFVKMMNARAAGLGMASTTFRNPHGLPASGQITTARDMLALSAGYLRAHPEALRYHSTRFMRHNGVVTYNKNPLLGNYPGADGLKTGWVIASGYNLVSTAHRGGTRLVAVVLGAEDGKARARAVYRLMEAGFLTSAGLARSVAEALPGITPAAHSLSLEKTISDAHAALAPGTLEKFSPVKRASYKKQRQRNFRKSAQAARKVRKATVRDAAEAAEGAGG